MPTQNSDPITVVKPSLSWREIVDIIRPSALPLFDQAHTGVADPKLDREVLELMLKTQTTRYLEIIDKMFPATSENYESHHRGLALVGCTMDAFFTTREARALDLQSAEMKAAYPIQARMLPFGIFYCHCCMDSRVGGLLSAGMSGRAHATAGGENKDFRRDRKGVSRLNPKSYSAVKTDSRLHRTSMHCQLFDSHVGCAARKASETVRCGLTPQDSGLRADVLKKKGMALTLQEYAETECRSCKVLALQISFDPHDGNVRMGLEKDDCLGDPRAVISGFTSEVMETLENEGKIISSLGLLQRIPEIRKVLDQYVFDIDYEIAYGQSFGQLWIQLEKMAPEVLPIIREALQNVFPALSDPAKKDELEQRSVLLLTNMFTIHCYMQKFSHWPFGEHLESIIVASQTNRPPYSEAVPFQIQPDIAALDREISLAASIVADNRQNGRFARGEKGTIESIYGYSRGINRAPVPVIFIQQIEDTDESNGDDESQHELSVKDHSLLNRMRHTDWSAIAETNWMTMSPPEFMKVLDRILPGIPATVVYAIEQMRTMAIKLYSEQSQLAEAMFEGRIIPFWLLAKTNRSAITLIPFLAMGYPEE